MQQIKRKVKIIKFSLNILRINLDCKKIKEVRYRSLDSGNPCLKYTADVHKGSIPLLTTRRSNKKGNKRDTTMKLEKIEYNLLNPKQKENYNIHKVASVLAEYGYNSLRLNDDWQGADFIAINGADMLKIQLKGTFTVDKKQIEKEIYIAFIENNSIKLYDHDEAVKMLADNITNSKSWSEKGGYSWGQTPKIYSEIIREI